MTTERKPFLAVNLTPAYSGYFVTLYDWSQLEGDSDFWFPEPYESGLERYRTPEEANAEALAWAEESGLECFLATPERIAAAEAALERSRKRVALTKQIRDEKGLSLREALAEAKLTYPD